METPSTSFSCANARQAKWRHTLLTVIGVSLLAILSNRVYNVCERMLAASDVRDNDNWQHHTFYLSGKPNETTSMLGHRKFGPYERRWPSGKLAVQGQNYENEPIGIWAWFDEDGTPQVLLRYEAGGKVSELLNIPAQTVAGVKVDPSGVLKWQTK